MNNDDQLTMEIEIPQMDDEREEMTDHDKHNNYLELVASIEYLNRNGRLSEDWLEETRNLIKKYRIWWPNLTFVNEDIKDTQFRKTCGEAELLLSELIRGIQSNDFLNAKILHIFLKKLKFIVDWLVPDDEKDLTGLEDIMSKLGV